MVTYTCPCCNQSVEVPILFGPARQRIFEFIWNNPRCTTHQIYMGIGAANRVTTCIYISDIANVLKRKGEFLMKKEKFPKISGRSGMRYRYEIILKPSVGEKKTDHSNKGSEDVTV